MVLHRPVELTGLLMEGQDWSSWLYIRPTLHFMVPRTGEVLSNRFLESN
jgi:hypothetical protein